MILGADLKQEGLDGPFRSKSSSVSDEEPLNYDNNNGSCLPQTKYLGSASSYKPDFGSKQSFQRKLRQCCSKKTLLRKLPIVEWLPKYSAEDFVGDLIAGITVAFTTIPQSIAYAELGRLPTQYGLYASFMGPFIYILFGTTKEVTIGPTAVMSLMTATYVASHGPAYAVILCFVSGIITTLMGLLKLGVVLQLISNPVTSGFASAAAIIIACSQLKSLLGLKDVEGERLVDILSQTFEKIGETNFYDLGMGMIGIASLLIFKNLKDFNLTRCVKDCKIKQILDKVIWVVSTSRNAILVVVCGLIATFVNQWQGENLFSQTETVDAGLPPPMLPPFTIPGQWINNTEGEIEFQPGQSFLEILSEAGSAVVIIPLLGILELMAICKTFAKGKPVDANQEMIALGLSQFAGSFFQSMPVTGSFTRCAVNGASGVRSPFGGLYTGALILLSLGFLTPYFNSIPKAALAAIIVSAMIYMVEYEEAIHMWRSKKIDLIPLFATFVSCLLIGLEFGILIGVAVSVLLLVCFSARPKVGISRFQLNGQTTILMFAPDRSLHFPGFESVRNKLSKKAFSVLENGNSVKIVVDCSNVVDVDFSAAKGISSLNKALYDRGQHLVFVNVRKNVANTLRGFEEEAEFDIFMEGEDWLTRLKEQHKPDPFSITVAMERGSKASAL